eukprot:3468930-Amphidinium_carterae.1
MFGYHITLPNTILKERRSPKPRIYHHPPPPGPLGNAFETDWEGVGVDPPLFKEGAYDGTVAVDTGTFTSTQARKMVCNT